jgi:type VI secretion system secreted protein Hcp
MPIADAFLKTQPFQAFLKIDGIPGESTNSKHKGEIDVLAFSWNIKQSIGPGGGVPQVSDFSIVKHLDIASPPLFAAVCTGDHIASALLTVESGSNPKGQALFYKVTFTEVLVSSVAPSGGGGDQPTEQVSLSFAKAEINFQDAAGGSKVATCDFSKGGL